MKTMLVGNLAVGVLGLSLAACSPTPSEPAVPVPAPAAEKPIADMPMDAPATTAAAGPIMGVGKVMAIDAATGTITLDHEPIPALSWSAMSMGFTASDPAILKGVAVGDTVSFEIKSQSESAVITQLSKK